MGYKDELNNTKIEKFKLINKECNDMDKMIVDLVVVLDRYTNTVIFNKKQQESVDKVLLKIGEMRQAVDELQRNLGVR